MKVVAVIAMNIIYMAIMQNRRVSAFWTMNVLEMIFVMLVVAFVIHT